MKTCPACGQDVRPVWPTCRACGHLLMAAPTPVAPIGAPVEAPGPSADEQFFAPAVLQTMPKPESVMPQPFNYDAAAGSGSAPGLGKWITVVGMVLFVICAVLTAYFTFKPGKNVAAEVPVALPPKPPAAGLPTDLNVIVRVEAESTRHTALQVVEDSGSDDLATLARNQPDYQWVTGSTPSDGTKTVSVAQSGTQVTIAVAASNHDVCAFGQWSPGGTPVYVTMEHEPTCAAVDAPNAGWSTQPGGAASDLPDDNS